MVTNAQLNPSGFYDHEAISKLLGVRRAMVSKAVNAGELRYSKRAGNMFFRGQWVIDWLEGLPAKANREQTEATAS